VVIIKKTKLKKKKKSEREKEKLREREIKKENIYILVVKNKQATHISD
jgi:hypothetical protein